MLQREFVMRQMARMGQLKDFPRGEETIDELTKAFLSAPDMGAVTAFVDHWIRTSADAPRPADIYNYFKPPGLLPAFAEPAEPKCKLCGDSGWVSVETRTGASFAKRCECFTSKVATMPAGKTTGRHDVIH